MPVIHFIEADGTRHTYQVAAGRSLMEVAVSEGVPGILGDCGGSCACATCHVYIPSPWAEQLGTCNPGEDALLEARDDRRPDSRLACQMRISDALDGLVVHLPQNQY